MLSEVAQAAVPLPLRNSDVTNECIFLLRDFMGSFGAITSFRESNSDSAVFQRKITVSSGATRADIDELSASKLKPVIDKIGADVILHGRETAFLEMFPDAPVAVAGRLSSMVGTCRASGICLRCDETEASAGERHFTVSVKIELQ
jgi:hypothetical protein